MGAPSDPRALLQIMGGSFSLSPAPATVCSWHSPCTHVLPAKDQDWASLPLLFSRFLDLPCWDEPSARSFRCSQPPPGQVNPPKPEWVSCHFSGSFTSSPWPVSKAQTPYLAFKALNSRSSTSPVLPASPSQKHRAQSICVPWSAPCFYTSVPLLTCLLLLKHS